MKHISWKKTGQFRNVIHDVLHEYQFVGLDESGSAIYDASLPKPIITFTGTNKIHGTHYDFCYNDIDGYWFQSRENIITPLKDNAGSAFFGESRKDILMGLINEIKTEYAVDTSTHSIMIASEFAGASIQKGVAIAGLPKSMYIFGVKIQSISDEDHYYVSCRDLRSPENLIFNIYDFKTYTVDVDFNYPELAQNRIVEITLEIENECPVAKQFLGDTENYADLCKIGEGVVLTSLYNGKFYSFKSKGLLHSQKSKVKTLKQVDGDKIYLLKQVAEQVTPEWRLEQMVEKACDLMNGGCLDRKKMGDYIRYVMADIVDEDMDILVENQVELKDINRYISEIAKQYFFSLEKI